MQQNFIIDKNEILSKHELLNQAKKTLKKEFIGIDAVIDEVIDSVTAWFLMAELQERPTIINLWGLTGVGKTALVNRLMELIRMEDFYMRFDLGDTSSSYSFVHSIEKLEEMDDNIPIVLGMDEFQHTRTKNPMNGFEVEEDKNRVLWDLMDSGKIQFFNLYKRHLNDLERFIYSIERLLKKGLKAENGIIVQGHKLFYAEFKEYFHDENDKTTNQPLVIDYYFDVMIENLDQKTKIKIKSELEAHLLTLNETETLEFMNRILLNARKPKVKMFRKALVVVMGNLDEAYTMNTDLNADMDADKFHNESLKITVPVIKSALQKRFRSEQIARLGNNHIIYPALNKNSFERIIEMELEKFRLNLEKSIGISIRFDTSINRIIYSEGVYPTQGVRPIFTTIHQILKSKISYFISEAYIQNQTFDSLHFHYEDQQLFCFYKSDNKVLFERSTKVSTHLNKIRKEKKDDLQAISAVHECGHAILTIRMAHVVPLHIYSQTANNGNAGFISNEISNTFMSKKDLIGHCAIFMGGIAAEAIVFGEENITTGSSTDIERATAFVSRMLKVEGMGETPILFGLSTQMDNDAYHNINRVEEDIRKVIQEALSLAKTTLKEEKTLLLQMANFLSDHRVIKQKEIIEMLHRYKSDSLVIPNGKKHLYYRSKLKELVQNLESESQSLGKDLPYYQLNKEV